MKKAKKTIIIIVAALVLLVLIALGIFFFMSRGDKGSEGAMAKLWAYNKNTVSTAVTSINNSLNREMADLTTIAEDIKARREYMYVHDIPLNPEYEIMDINFDELKQANSDVIGYIDFEAPDLDIISYPVYYKPGSHYYLDHNAAGASSVYGELYVEPGILNGHSKTNTIIYGHDMRNGSMFGSLDNYDDASYYEGRDFFWYYTPEGKYRYQIYSIHPTPYDGYAFSWFEKPCDEFTEYLTKSKQDAIYETGVTPENDDEIITLCTCTNSSTIRWVVHARLVYRDENISADTGTTADTDTTATEALSEDTIISE